MKNRILMALTVMTAAVWMLASSCSSPLSDTGLNEEDAALLKVEIILEKKQDHRVSSADNHILVYIKDKNGALVNIKDGSVSCNGVVMKEKATASCPYYQLDPDQVAFLPNTSYHFIITLTDGTELTADITTAPKDLHTLTAPTTCVAPGSLTISWEEPGSADQLYLAKYYTTDTTKIHPVTQTIDLTGDATGTYALGPDYLSDAGKLVKYILVEISAETEGTIDTRFKSSSSIISRYLIVREVCIAR